MKLAAEEYLINHLFLPPNLPQEDDWESGRGIIVDHVVECANTFYQSCPAPDADKLRNMITLMKNIQNKVITLRTAVKNMGDGGVILRRKAEKILLEYFQASPTVKAVNGTQGKLVIQFPCQPRLSFPHDITCIGPLCAYLVDITHTEMEDAVPETRKAGQQHKEYREVTDIRYISHLLGSIGQVLTSDADQIASTTVYVTKRIDDHALWSKAEKPWRRDPQWLVLRVALQTTLSEMKINGRYGYKAFIAFVLAQALRKACDADVSHDRLFVANAKIARRMMKLPSVIEDLFPFDDILKWSHHCSTLLEHRWRAIQLREEEPKELTVPSEEEILMAKEFQLSQSRSYLSDVYNRANILEQLNSQFSPSKFESSLSRSTRPVGSSPPADIPEGVSGIDLWLALTDVERWLSSGVVEWLRNTPPGDRLKTLKSFIDRIDSLLSSKSMDNPELFSRVFLMLLELWVMLDKTVVELIPMLEEYSSELSVNSFEPLLLPTLSQMKRLSKVEHGLRVLREKIRIRADEKREEKKKEFLRLKALYDDLTRECALLEHTYYSERDLWGFTHTYHRGDCDKCQKENQAKGLRITVFEWPLPEDGVLSQLTVFELRVPQPFAIWRDITYRLARNFSLTEGSREPSPSPILSRYAFVQDEFIPYCGQQLTIGSSGAKSFLVSHYRELMFPTTLSDVIKKHPLKYNLYDLGRSEWVPIDFPRVIIRKQCSPAVPPGPYEKLEWALANTTHTPNQVIANQCNCPPDLTYHEWDSYGHLRSGIRLQPRNIMRELVNGTLSFKEPAVYLLFRQAAWQVEKRSENSFYRESHFDFSDATFGCESLRILCDRLKTISHNWQEGWTATLLSLLASRILLLSIDPVVIGQTLEFLVDLREILWGWIINVTRLIDKNGQMPATAKSSSELKNRLIQLVVTCRSTYAPNPITGVVDFSGRGAAAIFIKCSIILQNTLPGSLTMFPTHLTHLRHLVEGDIVLSAETLQSLQCSLASSVTANEGYSELDDAVQFAWSGFTRNPVMKWRSIGDRWMACETAAEDNAAQIRYVYLNLLDGTLLVDGQTFGNLPKEILNHQLFQMIFPDMHTAAAAPSRLKGMSYELIQDVEGQIEVHFKMIERDLIIRTRERETNSICEFVYAIKLRGDIPNMMLQDTVIRYHESSKTVKFYPPSSGWNPSLSPLWTMEFTNDPSAPNTRLMLIAATSDARTNVLSPHSRLLGNLSAIFQPLEDSVVNLFVTYADNILEIKLPRYKLTFYLNSEGNYECRQLPGMYVSRVQSIGTLFGLKNKLILDSGDHCTTRKAIIPDGTISVSSASQHTPTCPEVTVNTAEDPNLIIKTFIFAVDGILGRLVGDDTLTSWYLQIYLHILTSYHLHDPLTQQTGVQQALTMLTSSKSYAFMALTHEDIHYLQMIIDLTPIRRYYPSHTKLMEQVNWHSDLSPLSQSDLFAQLIDEILLHAQNLALFQKTLRLPTYEGSGLLRARASFRFSRIISPELYAQLCIVADSSETVYAPACPSLQAERTRIVKTTSLARDWTSFPEFPDDWWKEFSSWPTFSNETDGVVRFDSMQAWLLKPPDTLWFSAYSHSMSKKIFWNAASRLQPAFKASWSGSTWKQWPCHKIYLPNWASASYTLLKTHKIQDSTDNMFCTRFLNEKFHKYASALQHTLSEVIVTRDLNIIPYSQKPRILDVPPPTYKPITLYGLIRSADRITPDKKSSPLEIEKLISRFSVLNQQGFALRYTNALERCTEALRNQPSRNDNQMHQIYAKSLRDALGPLSAAEKMLSRAGLWPSLGQECLLRQLSFSLRTGLSHEWKVALTRYAQNLSSDQREARLSVLRQAGRESEHARELDNPGWQKWEPLEHPDWLLIQLDSNILIRSVQAEIAQEMMFPRSQKNTVMQLNMGEGKSSVIVPITSVSLANGPLVRVITLKQLCVPMFRLLRQRVSGLANRRLYYMPFNRTAPECLDFAKVTTILDMFKACARTGGILLCQPEHILSFRLMGLHSLCDINATERTDALLKAHRWLEMSTRDILDESDEILNIRYQLIYTEGNSAPLHYQPNRWQIIQELLSVLKDLLVGKLGKSDDLSVEIAKPDQFPRTRILSSRGNRVLTKLAFRIVDNEAMPSIPFRSYPNAIRRSAFNFLNSATIRRNTYLDLKKYCGDSFDQMLLLRGLIAHGILSFSLKDKRWRVDYGLDHRRSSLAVPYRAKDFPALRSEFGHPDVIIVLTCLSYYYGGLTNSQLETTFKHLFKTDNPEVRYQSWVKSRENDIPKALHTLRGLNLEDPDLRNNKIFPALRLNKAVIDFYLSEYVFPREAKEFPKKLTTNAWDLAKEKVHLTTGFSGTNDQSYLLPLSIQQFDSPEQRHTNAQVIEYILLPENRTVVHTEPGITAHGIIKQVVKQEPPVTVLLDVGAQILELDNKNVAQYWLEQVTKLNIEAAIYCDSADDEFYVIDRKGNVEPLLHKTLVYLDEARTRGSDFKFPAKTRAVVTLGPKLSKDKLVQACMRMRQLGHTHSVLFFASEEIRKKIQEAINSTDDKLDSSHVLLWTMRETCTQIKENGALWASQGLNFDIRDRAWARYNDGIISVADLAGVLLEKESFTLDELYGIKKDTNIPARTDGDVSGRVQAIREKCMEFGIIMSTKSRKGKSLTRKRMRGR
ncbi:hypothetical protein BU17DRAFT_62083 [Hysterangium stoloniferum]|nr:hypothetical protein BU17DRAFT_62083 [Hysterangium stoloniferum]